MTTRKEFEMTPEQFSTLLEAIQPTPYIVVGGIPPMSVQERANAAWRKLGKEVGFDGGTAQPIPGKDSRWFSAIPVPVPAPVPVPEPTPFYVTFGGKYEYEPHPSGFENIHPDGWWTVLAKDYSAARGLVSQTLGGAWAFMYMEKPDIQVYPKGEMMILVAVEEVKS